MGRKTEAADIVHVGGLDALTSAGKQSGIMEVARLLGSTPKEHVRTRKGKGGAIYKYVTARYIEQVLNLCFGFLWSFEILSKEMITQGKTMAWVVHGRLSIRDRTGEELIRKEDYGVRPVPISNQTNKPNDAEAVAQMLKGAGSDALKRCAVQLGIAHDIYDQESWSGVVWDHDGVTDAGESPEPEPVEEGETPAPPAAKAKMEDASANKHRKSPREKLEARFWARARQIEKVGGRCKLGDQPFTAELYASMMKSKEGADSIVEISDDKLDGYALELYRLNTSVKAFWELADDMEDRYGPSGAGISLGDEPFSAVGIHALIVNKVAEGKDFPTMKPDLRAKCQRMLQALDEKTHDQLESAKQ